jgi:hypothetical protein
MFANFRVSADLDGKRNSNILLKVETSATLRCNVAKELGNIGRAKFAPLVASTGHTHHGQKRFSFGVITSVVTG